MTRQFWVLLHRYAGLVMALFLLVAGLTGSLLAFYEELDHATAPTLRRVALPAPGAQPLDAPALRERVIAHYAARQVKVTADFLPLRTQPGLAASVSIAVVPDPSGKPSALADDEVFVDPHTGRILGARKWGDISQGWKNLMPFIYRLHYSLALDGPGMWVMGIAALVWTLDCFVGFYLTLPVRVVRKAAAAKKANGKGWWPRWKPAWLVRWSGGAYKVNFDLHRAGGLWVWAMLFVLAWSSVGFNLREPVFDPVMKTLFTMDDPEAALPRLERPQPSPGMGWDQALRTGRALMAREAQRRGFQVNHEQYLFYAPERAAFAYSAHTSLDVNHDYGRTRVFFSANDGSFRVLDAPTGQASGNTVAMWLYALHMAHVWGLPFRIFVCAMGLVVAALCVTGIVIWLKKRRARGAKPAGRTAGTVRRQAPEPPAQPAPGRQAA